MKNIANYLEDYFDEDSGIYETVIRSKNDINKESMKAFKRGSREDEINAHGKPINYNHTFRDRTKYNRKDKHKQRYQ